MTHILPEKGISKQEIFAQLKQKQQQDFDWRTGRIFCSVYLAGKEIEEITKEAYSMFLTENPVDPTLFPSLRDMETEVVAMCSEVLQGGENAVGTLTTGGTESILLAVKTAKNRAKALNPTQTEFELIIPYSIHSAFFKACDYFEVTPIVIPLTPDFKADAKAAENAISKNTILIAASAPSYVFGVVDPIKEIGVIALNNNLLFHIDACIGGVVLGFNRLAGLENVPEFDFSVPGVTSISMDLHKYGYTAKGCSVLMHKDKTYRKHQYYACSEWTGYTLVNPTILSTKTGGPIAAAWAVMNFLGKKGYCDISRKTMNTTHRFIEGINAIDGLQVVGNPEVSLFSFTTTKGNPYDLFDELNEKRWFVQFQLSNEYCPANLHLTVSKIHETLVDEFLIDLKACHEKVQKKSLVKKATEKVTIETVKKLAQNLSSENFEKLGNMLGFSNGVVPDKLALINRIMDVLSPDTVRNTLIDYMNDFYTVNEKR
ncbi:aspartate aminotransferase family protein [Flavobacteriales bacterium]|nr:aspartate aminotransferase family protein [Flavobacteriales bacterium]